MQGNVLCNRNNQRNLCLNGLLDCGGRLVSGYIDARCIRLQVVLGGAHTREDWQAEMLTVSTRRDTSYDPGAPFDRLFCIGRGLAAGETLEDDTRVSPDFQMLDCPFII